MLRAGPLNERITLQYPVVARDAATGDETVTWATLRDVWARVEPIKGREAFAGGVSLADADTRMLIRVAPDIRSALSSKWRVMHRGRPYNLFSVAESNMGAEYFELLARTGANEG
jgi:SPP1 family predicted phage head-tail adaptor